MQGSIDSTLAGRQWQHNDITARCLIRSRRTQHLAGGGRHSFAVCSYTPCDVVLLSHQGTLLARRDLVEPAVQQLSRESA